MFHSRCLPQATTVQHFTFAFTSIWHVIRCCAHYSSTFLRPVLPLGQSPCTTLPFILLLLLTWAWALYWLPTAWFRLFCPQLSILLSKISTSRAPARSPFRAFPASFIDTGSFIEHSHDDEHSSLIVTASSRGYFMQSRLIAFSYQRNHGDCARN